MEPEDFAGHRVTEDETEWYMQGPAGWFSIPRDGRWQFNGNYKQPTFTPSLNEKRGAPGQSFEDYQRTGPSYISHLFVIDGRVQYLGDCTHEYAGQTHDLQEVNPVSAYCAWLRAHPKES